MSGIYIKGMEMPKRCGECPLSSYPHSPCWKNGGAVDWENRPNWCPLVPVPEHGRLIDKDWVASEEGPYDYDDWVDWALDRYMDAPVVIPADKEEQI